MRRKNFQYLLHFELLDVGVVGLFMGLKVNPSLYSVAEPDIFPLGVTG